MEKGFKIKFCLKQEINQIDLLKLNKVCCSITHSAIMRSFFHDLVAQSKETYKIVQEFLYDIDSKIIPNNQKHLIFIALKISM